jgi:hypothetical protein
MRVSRSRRAAAVAQTLAVAFAVSAAVVGAAYGVQRAVLREPTHGELVAARIEAVLLRYHYVRSTVHVDNEPPRTAECLEGWEPGSKGRPAGRGARVLFSDGERVILGDRRVLTLTYGNGASKLSYQPIALVQLAGCARSLTNRVYGHLVSTHRAHAAPTTFRGRPALYVHIRTSRDVFDVIVDPTTLVPIGMRLGIDGIEAWSSWRPTPITPARKASFVRRFGSG